MSAFLYGVVLQFKLDIRSRALLVTCYVVPLLFFVMMGGIYTSVMPESRDTLIQSMTVMGVSMGALIGLPPSLVEIYGSDIKKMYQANGVPLYFGLLSTMLSAFVHLMITSVIIFVTAPILYNTTLPKHLPSYFGLLAVFIVVSLSIGGILGLLVKNQSKLTMISQLVFLPSIMLSGIMFPADMLPKALESVGKVFPATWGYRLLADSGFDARNMLPMFVIFIAAVVFYRILFAKRVRL